MKTAIGVDIGGTSIKLGLVNAKGRLLERDSFLTEKGAPRHKTLAQLVDHIKALVAAAESRGLRVGGVGIGAPGPIDVERGFVYFFPNIPGWKDTPLKMLLETRLKKPVRLDNDANAMAFGEFLFGAGRGVKNAIALTLGTGVGGGIILDGRLYHGPTFSAAEIGHFIINENGPLCACGNHGCIEAYVGNGYFKREVERRLKSGQKSLLTRWLKEGRGPITPYLVDQAAKAGDAFSRKMWIDTGEHLGNALVGLVNIFNPQKIILGGGIAQDKPIFMRSIVATIKKKAFPIAAHSVRVVPAALGVDAGLIGAAALILGDSTT